MVGELPMERRVITPYRQSNGWRILINLKRYGILMEEEMIPESVFSTRIVRQPTTKGKRMGIRTFAWISSLLTMMMVAGCSTSGDKISPQGGISAMNEHFSISVPEPITIKQGASATVTLSITRGGSFKQDVRLDVTTVGIDIWPSSVIVKASDKPTAPLQLSVPRDAAIGEYRVYIKGTPESGMPTASEFIVTVVGL